jgi:hypothetical protein
MARGDTSQDGGRSREAPGPGPPDARRPLARGCCGYQPDNNGRSKGPGNYAPRPGIMEGVRPGCAPWARPPIAVGRGLVASRCERGQDDRATLLALRVAIGAGDGGARIDASQPSPSPIGFSARRTPSTIGGNGRPAPIGNGGIGAAASPPCPRGRSVSTGTSHPPERRLAASGSRPDAPPARPAAGGPSRRSPWRGRPCRCWSWPGARGG